MRILLCKTFQWMSAMRFLSDKDLECMASYEQGDTILFQSSNGIDTMTIDEVTLYNDDNPWRENEGSSTYMGNSAFEHPISSMIENLK